MATARVLLGQTRNNTLVQEQHICTRTAIILITTHLYKNSNQPRDARCANHIHIGMLFPKNTQGKRPTLLTDTAHTGGSTNPHAAVKRKSNYSLFQVIFLRRCNGALQSRSDCGHCTHGLCMSALYLQAKRIQSSNISQSLLGTCMLRLTLEALL